jgi:hypothetical protein
LANAQANRNAARANKEKLKAEMEQEKNEALQKLQQSYEQWHIAKLAERDRNEVSPIRNEVSLQQALLEEMKRKKAKSNANRNAAKEELVRLRTALANAQANRNAAKENKDKLKAEMEQEKKKALDRLQQNLVTHYEQWHGQLEPVVNAKLAEMEALLRDMERGKAMSNANRNAARANKEKLTAEMQNLRTALANAQANRNAARGNKEKLKAEMEQEKNEALSNIRNEVSLQQALLEEMKREKAKSNANRNAVKEELIRLLNKVQLRAGNLAKLKKNLNAATKERNLARAALEMMSSPDENDNAARNENYLYLSNETRRDTETSLQNKIRQLEGEVDELTRVTTEQKGIWRRASKKLTRKKKKITKPIISKKPKKASKKKEKVTENEVSRQQAVVQLRNSLQQQQQQNNKRNEERIKKKKRKEIEETHSHLLQKKERNRQRPSKIRKVNKFDPPVLGEFTMGGRT